MSRCKHCGKDITNTNWNGIWRHVATAAAPCRAHEVFTLDPEEIDFAEPA